MALYKIEEFAPDYRDSFDGKDIKGHGVYTEGDEKVGTVSDILVDEEGRLRYFVVDLGFWILVRKCCCRLVVLRSTIKLIESMPWV